MERILQSLEHEVTCTICQEPFRTPKTLPCLHTFCCQCLNDHLDYRRRANFPVNCPLCAVEIQVPNGDTFDSLPTSFYHNRLLEILSIKQCSAGSNMACGNCKKLTDDSWYCFQCSKFFCSDCINAHNLLGSLHENHRVISVKEFGSQDYEALIQRQPFCQQQYHEKEVLRYFCTQCDTCICQVCFTVEHSGHGVEHLQKAAEDQKQAIQSVLQNAEKKVEVYEKTVQNVEQVSAELETNVNTVRREIRETVDRLKLAIEEMERETVTELLNIQRDRQTRLDDIKKVARNRLKALNESMEYVNTIKNEGTSAEILQVKHAMQQRFQELLQDESDSNLTVKDGESFIQFYPDKDIKPPKLGQLQSKKTYPSLSVLMLNTEPFNVQASKQVKMEVVTKDPSGETCYVPETQLDIVVEPQDDVSELNTLDEKNGEYDVTFRPQVPGKYSVEVKIENKHIQNSPQTLEVKPRELIQMNVFELKKPQSGEQVKPSGIAISGDGEIAIVDYANGRILMYSKEGEFLCEFGHHGSGNGQLDEPSGAAFTADGKLVIGDQCNHRVQLFDSKTGEFLSCFGGKGIGDEMFKYPVGVSVDSDGRIIVCDFATNRVQVFDRTNRFLFKFGDVGEEKLSLPYHCLFHNNKFFVTDYGHHCIKVFDNNGEYLYKFGKRGTEDGEFSGPYGLCVHSDNTLIVCNYGNPGDNCIQVFTLDGRFVGKSVQPIKGCWEAARFPDGTIAVTSFTEGRVYFLK